jgi:hypothetical protein
MNKLSKCATHVLKRAPPVMNGYSSFANAHCPAPMWKIHEPPPPFPRCGNFSCAHRWRPRRLEIARALMLQIGFLPFQTNAHSKYMPRALASWRASPDFHICLVRKAEGEINWQFLVYTNRDLRLIPLSLKEPNSCSAIGNRQSWYTLLPFQSNFPKMMCMYCWFCFENIPLHGELDSVLKIYIYI